MKEGFIDEGEPVYVTAGVKGGPVDEGVKSAVVGTEGGVSGEPDGGVIQSVECGECTFTCRSVNCVTVIKHRENGQLYESAFSGWGERMTVSVEKSKFGLNLGL